MGGRRGMEGMAVHGREMETDEIMDGVGSQVSLMRPSLKPRNLAISTGDLFCSDELNHAGR